MRRVLFVASSLSGGVATSIAELARALEGAGVRVGIFGLTGEASLVAGAASLGAEIGGRRRLVARVARGRFDVIHATAFAAGHRVLGPSLALARAVAPVVVTAHTTFPVDLRRRPFDAYTAVSPGAAAALSVPAGAAVEVIPNAVDPTRFSPPVAVTPVARPRLLWVGRTLDADWLQKDVAGLLHLAASDLGLRHRVVLVEREDRRSWLGVGEWVPSERVELRVGLSRDEVGALYREVAAEGGAWLSTSRAEGMPMTLLEAWASGCPAVVPRAPGFEIVTDGEDGLVYAREDGVPGVARALARLGEPGVAARLGAAGRARVLREHSPAIALARTISVYERLPRRGRLFSPARTWRMGT